MSELNEAKAVLDVAIIKWNQKDSTAGKALTLHADSLGSTSGIPRVTLSPLGVILKHRASSKP